MRRTAPIGGSGRSSPAAASARRGPARNGSGSAPAIIPAARIALVGGTADEVAEYQIEGDSGLLAIARGDERPRWLPSKGRFFFPSGAVGFVRTAERPAKLRGAQHHFAWCDELAKWPRAGAAWDNLMFGLRLGDRAARDRHHHAAGRCRR